MVESPKLAEWSGCSVSFWPSWPRHFKSKLRLEAENAVLRHQLIVLRRKLKGRARLTNSDRWFFVQMYRCFPSILKVVTIVQPETLVSWHRAGFRRYWRWKSRRRGGRPQTQADLRTLIRRMSVENPLWGSPRIHGNCSSSALRSLKRRQIHGEAARAAKPGVAMHQSLVRYSAPVSFVHARSRADFIATMVGFKAFGTHNGPDRCSSVR